MKQTTFASLAFDRKKKQTRRERFLAEMETVVPWSHSIQTRKELSRIGYPTDLQHH